MYVSMHQLQQSNHKWNSFHVEQSLWFASVVYYSMLYTKHNNNHQHANVIIVMQKENKYVHVPLLWYGNMLSTRSTSGTCSRYTHAHKSCACIIILYNIITIMYKLHMHYYDQCAWNTTFPQLPSFPIIQILIALATPMVQVDH